MNSADAPPIAALDLDHLPEIHNECLASRSQGDSPPRYPV